MRFPVFTAANTSGAILVLFWASATGAAEVLPTVAELKQVVKNRREEIRSLYVVMERRSEALADPQLIQEWLSKPFPLNEKSIWAFEREKRYLRLETTDLTSPVTRLYRDRAVYTLEETTATVWTRILAPHNQFDFLYLELNQFFLGDPTGDGATNWTRSRALLPQSLAEPSPKLTSSALDGQACVCVEIPLEVQGPNGNVPCTEKLWLARDKGYALLKREVNDSQTGRPETTVVCSDLKEVHPSVWFPRHVEFVEYVPSWAPTSLAAPLRKSVFEISELIANEIPDSLFEIPFAPGMVVQDFVAAARTIDPKTPITYVVPADPDQLNAVIQAALKQVPEQSSAARPRPSLTFWTNFTIVTAIAIFVLVRRMATRSGS